jgi:glucosylceramidase
MLLPLALCLTVSMANSAVCNSFSKSENKVLEGICVCSSNDCHKLPSPDQWSEIPIDRALAWTTSKDGKRFFQSEYIWTLDKKPFRRVDPNITYQFIIGFGGAFTDAAAINLHSLQKDLQDNLLDSYFGPSGSEYSLGRVPISSTDFSTSVYSYNDNPGDFEHLNFSIAIDMDKKIPMIKRALSRTNLTLLSSSWAPPTWMTPKNNTVDCSIIGSPGSKYWKSYALYLSKFFSEYKKEGINFWAMTVQNEPVQPPAITKLPFFHHWQALRLTSVQEQEFILNDLGPRLKQDHPELLIIGYDDQKYGLDSWHASLDDPATSSYVSGTAVHWYGNVDYILDIPLDSGDKLDAFHKRYPNKFILATEACEGYLPLGIGTGRGTALNDSNKRWQRAENYARDIIGDLNHWVSGWIDWNLILDGTGGPNWAGNMVDAPIIAGSNGKEFYKQPMYYILAHFSKFLVPGSVRIGLDVKMASTAFKTPNGQIVVILHNRYGFDSKFTLGFKGKSISVLVGPESLQTIVFDV